MRTSPTSPGIALDRRRKGRRPAPLLITEAPRLAEDLDRARPRIVWWGPLLVLGLATGVWAMILGAWSILRATAWG